MDLIRGTTPTIYINIRDEIDLSKVVTIWIYVYQNNSIKICKELSDVSINIQDRQIIVELSQVDTLSLKRGDALFQIRILLNDGTALATKASNIHIDEIYKDGVINED